MGGLDGRAAAPAGARFEAMVNASFSVILPAADDFHLAIANNYRAPAIYTLDRALLKAGNILGLPVSIGISMM